MGAGILSWWGEFGYVVGLGGEGGGRVIGWLVRVERAPVYPAVGLLAVAVGGAEEPAETGFCRAGVVEDFLRCVAGGPMQGFEAVDEDIEFGFRGCGEDGGLQCGLWRCIRHF